MWVSSTRPPSGGPSALADAHAAGEVCAGAEAAACAGKHHGAGRTVDFGEGRVDFLDCLQGDGVQRGGIVEADDRDIAIPFELDLAVGHGALPCVVFPLLYARVTSPPVAKSIGDVE